MSRIKNYVWCIASSLLISAVSVVPTTAMESKVQIDITPNILDVKIPLVTTFTLGEEGNIYPDIVLENNSYTHVDISIEKIENGDDISPTIVSPNKFADKEWDYLSSIETHQYLALGIHEKDDLTNINWLSYGKEFPLGTIEPKGQKIYNFTSRNGKRWYKDFELNYNLFWKATLSYK